MQGPESLRASSVEPVVAHPSSQEVDARVLPDPVNIGHTDSSQTGIERGSVPAQSPWGFFVQ